MTKVKLKEKEWTKIREFLKQDPNAYVGNEAECRRFVEAVLWINRSGAQWRLLPGEYGHWNTVYKRFARWCDAGVWERMFLIFGTHTQPKPKERDSQHLNDFSVQTG